MRMASVYHGKWLKSMIRNERISASTGSSLDFISTMRSSPEHDIMWARLSVAISKKNVSLIDARLGAWMNTDR